MSKSKPYSALAVNHVVWEPVRPVTISFAPERLKRFQQLLRELGRQLGQESIYTRFEEPRIELADVRFAP